MQKGAASHGPDLAATATGDGKLLGTSVSRFPPVWCWFCNKIAEAEAAVSVNEKKWLVMHVHVQLKLDELRGPPNPWLTVT
jgi:hypothetical protein